ncbi:MAG: hypothetical protein MI796_17895, partial [Enterobacterales bacterium]|nr:hypothetical protein [Enterobacterales bacterium]
DGFYSLAAFDKESKTFVGTQGGKWKIENKQFVQSVEFDTFAPEKVGSELTLAVSVKGGKLNLGDKTYTRIDNNKPGALAGAWLITGRKRGDEMREIREGPRKTMKILSGTRFQWIAYNVETKQFMGTGGGTYTSEGGQYVENIDLDLQPTDSEMIRKLCELYSVSLVNVRVNSINDEQNVALGPW